MWPRVLTWPIGPSPTTVRLLHTTIIRGQIALSKRVQKSCTDELEDDQQLLNQYFKLLHDSQHTQNIFGQNSLLQIENKL